MSDQANYVFLHGGRQGGWVWAETIAALHSQTDGSFGRALALDAPGCGAKRAAAVEGLMMEDVARELIRDIEASGMRDIILIGHSQAGQALPCMARFRPDLFQRLVYVSCSLPLPGQSVREMMGQSRHGENENEVGWPFDPKTMDLADGLPLMFCNDMAPDQAAWFRGQLGHDAWPPKTYTMRDWCYDGVGAVPASYVICLKDNILTPPWQEVFARRFQADRLMRIDAGHQVMNTRPHALAEVLRHEARPPIA